MNDRPSLGAIFHNLGFRKEKDHTSYYEVKLKQPELNVHKVSDTLIYVMRSPAELC